MLTNQKPISCPCNDLYIAYLSQFLCVSLYINKGNTQIDNNNFFFSWCSYNHYCLLALNFPFFSSILWLPTKNEENKNIELLTDLRFYSNNKNNVEIFELNNEVRGKKIELLCLKTKFISNSFWVHNKRFIHLMIISICLYFITYENKNYILETCIFPNEIGYFFFFCFKLCK